MPRKINRQLKRNKKLMEAILEAEPVLDAVNETMNAIDVPMVRLVARHLLDGKQLGYNYTDIQKVLKDAGYKIGQNKLAKVVKAAKAEIVTYGEDDLQVNYGWAQANLMDMHRDAVERGDQRQRFVVIKALIELWGLNRPHEEVKQTEITPEMIEQFEQRLLR